ncbi:MAG: hypothetical protein JO111_01810 [Caulobacteraceae bacterium]|nr:hypothetical protein [Caulobacteraceae bacterium]
MNADRPRLVCAAAAALAAVSLASASMAVTAQADPLAGLGSLQKTTATLTVKSVDTATRHLVVTDTSGKDFSLKAPASVQNLDQLKPGDRIKATYALETEFALSPPNGKLPPNTQTVIAARAAKGDLPAGIVANHIVITGAIIGIDMTNHTLKVVNPKGGMVHTISVQRPEGRAAMAKLKVGDYVTAYITEGLLISTTRA